MTNYKDKDGKSIGIGDRILSYRDGRIDDIVIKTIDYLPYSKDNDEGYLINKEDESLEDHAFHFADSIIKKEEAFTLEQIATAWNKAYGENMRQEYSGFFEFLTQGE